MSLFTTSVGASANILSSLGIILLNLLLLLPSALLVATLWTLHALQLGLGRVFAVAIWPIATAAALVWIVFAPIIYTVSYTVAPFFYLASLVPKLEVSPRLSYGKCTVDQSRRSTSTSVYLAIGSRLPL
jgi:hypothetical protein